MIKSKLTKNVLLLLLLAAVMCGCSAGEKQEYITIGALLPLTGEDSDEGLRALNGLHLAKKKINESGGVLGKTLDVIVLNDRGDEEYVVKQYEALKEMGVAAIIGSSYSHVTMALAKASEKDGIPVISPTASDPEVTKGRGNVFRAIFIDDYQSEVLAYFAYNSLGAETALVLRNISSDSYGKSVDIFTDNFTKHGGKVIAVENFSSAREFPRILRRYTENKPDVIFCPENFARAARLINSVHNTGLAGTHILGTDAWDGVLAYVSDLDAMKNVYYSAPFSFDDHDEGVTEFVKNYFNAFSQMPLSGSATAYTCVYILAAAINKAGNTNSGEIISAIKLNELDVITGQIKFDENNNPHANVYILKIEGGVYSTFEKLSL